LADDPLEAHGQGDLRRFEEVLDEPARRRLEAEIAALDLDQLDHLIATLVRADPAAAAVPLDLRAPRIWREHDLAADRRRAAIAAGEQALRDGHVAVVLVAGGDGSRLGYDGPKGIYPIGPVSGASLFQIHAEKVRALSQRYGRTVPFLIMTGPANHERTAAFFAEHENFGLEHLRLFVQGTMPAVDASGRILLAEPGRIALSPDGHGGLLAALDRSDGGPSCLDELRELGVRTLFTFQVDNPLTIVADPLFVGLHRIEGAEMSTKVVEKTDPHERVGVVAEADGATRLIEYSDLPDELAERRAADGGLELRAGSIAIHLLELEFAARVARREGGLPFHRAWKKVATVDDKGHPVEPDEPNAFKFERFIFDALPLAEGTVVVMETSRQIEFEPLKNATGDASPDTVRAQLLALHRGWLEAAGAHLGRDADGSPVAVEISPLWALDAMAVADRIEPDRVFDRPTYLR